MCSLEAGQTDTPSAFWSISNMFRLGTLAGEGDGTRMVEIQDESGPIAQQMMFLPSWILPYMPFYKRFIKIMNENIDICDKHLSKAVANLTEDSETVIAKLYASCGKDSAIPLIMAMDSITAGIDTTGGGSNKEAVAE